MIMKFVLQQVHNGCRLGLLSGFGQSTVKELESPMCMMYTRGGAMPHLTRDMFQYVANLPMFAHVSCNYLVDNAKVLKLYQQGLGKFCALQDFFVYCCLQDPTQAVPVGYNDKGGVAVWSRGGKSKLDVDSYMELMESCQPGWIQSLCDSDTNLSTSRQRVQRSVNRTLQYTESCVERLQGSQRLVDCGLIGVVLGGSFVDERIRSASLTAKMPLAGFSIEGFHGFGPETESFQISDIEDVLRKTLAELPADKPRILPGIMSPIQVLNAVQLGCDIFDSSYAYTVTDRDAAMVFDFVFENCSANETSTVTELSNTNVEISLKDKRYCDDFTPLLDKCTCYTCQTHTRAYVHHLVVTSELLAATLLMIHNLHHYCGYFSAIRRAISADKMSELRQVVMTTTQT